MKSWSAAVNTDVSLIVTMIDEGPGIADINAAFTPGFSMSWGGGLAGVRRLIDHVDIRPQPVHTDVSININLRSYWLRRRLWRC